MAPAQDRMANPYGMDEECPRCPALVDTRQRVVHGYGDVAADFVFVAESPSKPADERGFPVGGDELTPLGELLEASGFLPGDTDEAGQPVVENAYITHLTRCRHPDRAPTDEEVANCEPFLNAELRTINPEILVPLGKRVLAALAGEYSTVDPDEIVMEDVHASELRGRGFELLPLVAPPRMDADQFEAAVDRFDRTRQRDYRQTKGRRER